MNSLTFLFPSSSIDLVDSFCRYLSVDLFVCLSVCQLHIFELLSMIHFAMQDTMYCPTTSSVHRLN